MRGLHGVSTVHESEPLMHQTISAVPCLWGFARKWVLFKTRVPPPLIFSPFLIWNSNFNNEHRFPLYEEMRDWTTLDIFYAPILEQLWRKVWTQQADGGLLSAPARHICMAAVAENGITKSVTNLIKPLISNKLA